MSESRFYHTRALSERVNDQKLGYCQIDRPVFPQAIMAFMVEMQMPLTDGDFDALPACQRARCAEARHGCVQSKGVAKTAW